MAVLRQQQVLNELANLGSTHPTVHVLARRLKRGYQRVGRRFEDEVRRMLDRLEVRGYVSQYRDEGDRMRYCVRGREPDTER